MARSYPRPSTRRSFLASASLKDILRCWQRVHGGTLDGFAEKNICQLNDTHPTIAVAELMRLLID